MSPYEGTHPASNSIPNTALAADRKTSLHARLHAALDRIAATWRRVDAFLGDPALLGPAVFPPEEVFAVWVPFVVPAAAAVVMAVAKGELFLL